MRHARWSRVGALLAWGLALPAAPAQQAQEPVPGPAVEAPVAEAPAAEAPAAAAPGQPAHEQPQKPELPAADSEPIPDAPALVRRAMAAHKALGPATIVTTMTGSFEGEPMTITVTSQRNDATHFAASARARLGRITLDDGIWQWYRNGAKEIFYDATDNRYYHTHGAAPFPPDLMSAFLAEVDPATLAPPKASGTGTRTETGVRVTVQEVEGRPGYEVVVPGMDARAGNAGASRMFFDKADALIREFRFTDSGGAFDVTVVYTPAGKPFPAALFAFTPPAGAREVKPAAKAPVKKPAAGKPPAKKGPVRTPPPSRLPRR